MDKDARVRQPTAPRTAHAVAAIDRFLDVRLHDAAHVGAQVDGLEPNRYAFGLYHLRQPVCDLLSEPLLPARPWRQPDSAPRKAVAGPIGASAPKGGSCHGHGIRGGRVVEAAALTSIFRVGAELIGAR